MKILVFGGSFDPVHRGHLALLRAADRRLRPDRIVLLPSGRPPHKAPPAACFSDRVALLKAALREPGARRFARRTVIDRFEERGRGPHYTVRSLGHLRRRWPGAEFFLLIGSDQLASFGRWHRPDRIRRLSRLVAGRRRGASRPREDVLWLRGLFPELSSSQVRGVLAEGRSPAPFVPKAVEREIRRRGLYGTAWIAWLRARLEPGRLRHTFAVVRAAAALAERHGLDVWKARQAALLHDAGRAFDRSGLLRYARAHPLKVPRRGEIERREPMLLHAYVSADLARRRFGVSDPDVLGAIARHTLGAPGMTPLQRLLYVADAGSEDRMFPHAKRIRDAGARGLTEGLRLAAKMKLDWVRSQGGWVHPLGEATLQWASKTQDARRRTQDARR